MALMADQSCQVYSVVTIAACCINYSVAWPDKLIPCMMCGASHADSGLHDVLHGAAGQSCGALPYVKFSIAYTTIMLARYSQPTACQVTNVQVSHYIGTVS